MGYKILHITAEINWSGGEVQVLCLCNGLRSVGHICALACPPGSAIAKRAADDQLSVWAIKMRSRFDPFAIIELIRIIKAERIDIVHSHSYTAYYLAAIVSFLTGRKHIMTRRVTTFLKPSLINKVIYNKMVKICIAVSRAVRSVLIESGIKPEKIVTIYEGIELLDLTVETNKNTAKPDFVEAAGAIKIGCIANICRRKGIRFLIDAAKIVTAKYPRAVFFIVGDGILRDELEDYMHSLGLQKKVIFTGFQNNPWLFLSDLDIYVQPSLNEGLGVAILEAMYRRKPVVATKIEGIAESVIDRLTGILIDRPDGLLLAEALIYLIDNPDLARAMGDNGFKRVCECFNIERTVSQHERLYEELIKERQGRT